MLWIKKTLQDQVKFDEQRKEQLKMTKKKKPTFVEYGKGLIESNKIKIMAEGRQIYYYEFED